MLSSLPARSQPRILVGLLLSLIVPRLFAAEISRVEPAHWWVGMQERSLQIMLYGSELGNSTVQVDDASGVRVLRTVSPPNSNYLFVYLDIAPATTPGEFTLTLQTRKGTKLHHSYSLRERESGVPRGFDSSDVIYLITPDRFANGDPGNDEVAGMREGLNRDDDFGRHGGDLAGVTHHLDYLDDLGVTQLWLNPVRENNMPKWSYHGYAITDFYRIDPRFGTHTDYLQLSAEARRRGIGLIMDMIPNHCGLEHWFVQDPPSRDWINFDGNFVGTHHARTTNQDIHAAEVDRRRFADGWFVSQMPDLNQRNPLMADYLIQNAIWWIEEAGLAGVRVDTYPYPDKHFMARWSAALMKEYPNLGLVGEEWSLSPALIAYWQRGKANSDGYVSAMPNMMDFPLNDAVRLALTAPEESWNAGFIRLYEAVAHDFLYAAPNDLVIFPDNHDMDRFYTQVGEDLDLFKLGLVFNLTMRGIPQLFYGTEILMHNRDHPHDHGVIRTDFPGGWPDDEVNAFTGVGLSADQKGAHAFVRKLLQWRQTAKVIHDGRLLHFMPDDGTYCYFRYTDDAMVMVVLNKRTEPALLDTARFAEILPVGATGTDVLTGETQNLAKEVTVPARGAVILEIAR